MVTETELRDRLHSAAWRVGRGGDDDDAADAVIARRRTERRHRAAALGAGVCVLVIAVLVPVLGQRWLVGQAPAGPRTATPTAVSSADPTRSDPWTGPTRGSLAGDTAFLQAARTLTWPDTGTAAPAVADRTVLFAGDAAGTRWVLVAGPVTGQRLAGQWFTGPAGAAADALTDDGSGQEDLQGDVVAVSHVHPDETGATLLVVTDPSDEVRVSPGVVVDGDGRVTRSYEPVATHRGIAAVHESGPFAGSAVRFRVVHDGQVIAAGPSGSTYTIPADIDDAAGQTPRRPGSGSAPRTAVENALLPVFTATGLTPADVHPVLLWTGPIPLESGGASTQAVVLALTLPSGAVVTTTAFNSQDIALPSGTCGTAVHPAGTRIDDLVVVARCDTSMGNGGKQVFVVSAPRADSRVVLLAADGTSRAQLSLVDGAGSVPDPFAVDHVEVSGPAAPTVRVTPTDDAHDPFAVD